MTRIKNDIIKNDIIKNDPVLKMTLLKMTLIPVNSCSRHDPHVPDILGLPQVTVAPDIK